LDALDIKLTEGESKVADQQERQDAEQTINLAEALNTEEVSRKSL